MTVAVHRSWAKDLDTGTLYELLKLRVEVICTLRLMEEHAGGQKAFRLGRLCTRREARGHGHTTRLLQAALADVGDYPCRIDAQTYLEEMYARHGFVRAG